MQVEGKMMTPFGVMKFVLRDAKNATLSAMWKVNRVEYRARVEVFQPEELANSEVGLVWEEKAGSVDIKRVDGKPINYKTDTYNNIRNGMISSWGRYTTEKHTRGVLVLAALANQLNKQSALTADVATAERQLHNAEQALYEWKAKNSDLVNSLKMGAEQSSTYDKNNVVIVGGES